MALFQYFQQFTRGLNASDGNLLAVLLKKNALSKFPTKNQATLNLEPALEKQNIDDYCSGQIMQPWDEIIALHFKGVLCIHRSHYVDAYNFQSGLVQAFLRIFQNEERNWSLPILHAINRDLRLTAKLADYECRQKGQKEGKLEDAARILNSCFAACIRDNAPFEQSKKQGTLHIINNQFKIYFYLNNLQLCKNVIRPVESSKGFPPITSFPVSQVVTFKFYVGRLAMSEGHFKKAEEELSYAFQHCTDKSEKNKSYLVPVKLLVGKMPSIALLTKHNFTQFADLTKAVQSGNLKLFNETLAKYQDFFMQKGIYLILEKTKTLTYRNLFKKVFLILNTTKLPLTYFLRAFEWMGIQIDLDEIECIVANLIFNGSIKGYISHQQRCLVVSAKNAFPPSWQ